MSLRKSTAVWLAVAIAAVCWTPVFAQAPKADGNKVKAHIEYLASDQLEGRQTLTPGYQKAADYVAAKFKEYGLKPSGDNGTSYFQKVPIARPVTVNVGTPALSVDNRAFSFDDSDFTINAQSTAKTAVKAPVVFVGYGLSLPAKGLDEYAGLDVKGKIVLALKGSPEAYNPPAGRGMMSGTPTAPPAPIGLTPDEITDAAKIKNAFDKGAAAVLLYDPNPSPASRIMMMGGPMGGANAPAALTRNFLAFDVTERVFKALMRKPAAASASEFSKTLNAIRSDIKAKKPRSIATGAQAVLKGYDEIKKYAGDGINVIGKIEGTDPALKDQSIVIGGHLDHLGARGPVVMNGADDDASGPAVAMEVARVLTQSGFKPKRTVVFAAWCGEEMGLLGSNHFGSKPPAGISMDKVVTNFNLDMVALGDGIGAPGALNFPGIWDVIKKDQDPDVISVVHPSTAGPGGSDYSAFITKGIEALALMTDGGVGHPDYHDSGDDTYKADPEILRKTAQFVVQGVINTANETAAQMLVPDRLYLYNSMMLRFTNINAALPGAAWKINDFATKAALLGRMYEREIARSQATDPTVAQIMVLIGQPAPAAPGRNQPVRKDAALGVKSAVFGGDAKLLDVTSAGVGFGRVEFSGDDSSWVVGGRLTDAGKAALKVMEAGNVFAQLVAPGEALLGDFLAAAEKPFLVTGVNAVPEGLKDKIIAKKVVWAVDYDPEDVPAGLAKADAAKKTLGSANNLIAFPKSIEKLNDLAAKRAFYFGLIKLGWKVEEIAFFTGNSLRALTPGGPAMMAR